MFSLTLRPSGFMANLFLSYRSSNSGLKTQAKAGLSGLVFNLIKAEVLFYVGREVVCLPQHRD
jgi:hypothetical protein